MAVVAAGTGPGGAARTGAGMPTATQSAATPTVSRVRRMVDPPGESLWNGDHLAGAVRLFGTAVVVSELSDPR
ncbi:hypothetical protein KRMM14A1004_58400 [Krasilnikovia sp. MM14-A1004]